MDKYQNVTGQVRHVVVIGLTLSVLWLQGCASVPAADSGGSDPVAGPVANEPLLKAAGNHAGLIELYKDRLQTASDVQTADSNRYQLGVTYLEAYDAESTLFYINPVIEAGRADASILLLQSRAFLVLDQQGKALQAAVDAMGKDAKDPRIANQLGLIYADMEYFSEAKRFFHKARKGMLDDAIVMNNLAMIDILEKNYRSAVERLMPLYNTGQADDRVTANLVVALVQGGMYEEFKSVYTGAKTEQERMDLYRAISTMEPRRLSESEE
ncbi:tetratricopeptide repeat protein [Endozoicomonas sp.]|uniref:tetratricopeptide repeat protein n=1 Tax=Endozoicomonas sp. TaxID=1892382 RepID=UPI00288473D3|nr:hypothetical protein [Endozoicomonas sp.]